MLLCRLPYLSPREPYYFNSNFAHWQRRDLLPPLSWCLLGLKSSSSSCLAPSVKRHWPTLIATKRERERERTRPLAHGSAESFSALDSKLSSFQAPRGRARLSPKFVLLELWASPLASTSISCCFGVGVASFDASASVAVTRLFARLKTEENPWKPKLRGYL